MSDCDAELKEAGKLDILYTMIEECNNITSGISNVMYSKDEDLFGPKTQTGDSTEAPKANGRLEVLHGEVVSLRDSLTRLRESLVNLFDRI